MSYLPLISIPILYFSIALLKPHLQKIIKLNICAICLAVSLSWMIMIPLFLLGEIEGTSLAILMGMSITGIMYKLEAVFKSAKIRNFWFTRVLIIVGGYYLISTFINEMWHLLILLAVVIPMSIFMSSIFFQGTKHEDALNEVKSSKKSLIKRLEDCC